MSRDDLLVAVVSSGRPASVDIMTRLLDGLEPIWFVPEGEGADYRYAAQLAGVTADVREQPATTVPGQFSLPLHRNAPLDLAAADGRTVVTFDDDLTPWKRSGTGLSMLGPDGDERPISVRDAISITREAMASVGAHLGGGPPTTNRFFYNAERPVSTNLFVIATFMVIEPGLRFYTGLGTKEDYDLTLQHLHEHGVVARVNGLMANFKHYSPHGGCTPVRSLEYEQASVATLMARWPNDIRPNKKRPGEVLLRWAGGRTGPTQLDDPRDGDAPAWLGPPGS